MTTREMAREYRLSHWAQIMRERQENRMSIKTYCENAGLHENVYYYWQRKFRDAAAERAGQTQGSESSLVPSGWTRLVTGSLL